MNKISLLMLLLMAISAGSPVQSGQPFKIFDATLYSNKGDLSQCGFESIKVIYESEIFKNKKQNIPTEKAIKALALKYKDYSWLVFDIEKWDHGKSSILSNVELYINFVKVFKKYNKESKVGYYGVMPIRDYWRASGKKGREELEEWTRENGQLEQLANVVDAIFPSIYTFYMDQPGWALFAKAQIEMAKSLSKGKPVYPFIWPSYHESNFLLSHRYIGNEYWTFQLNTMKKYADGALVWGGWSNNYHGPKNWQKDKDMDWWLMTKQFLNKSKCDEI